MLNMFLQESNESVLYRHGMTKEADWREIEQRTKVSGERLD